MLRTSNSNPRDDKHELGQSVVSKLSKICDEPRLIEEPNVDVDERGIDPVETRKKISSLSRPHHSTMLSSTFDVPSNPVVLFHHQQDLLTVLVLLSI